MVKVIFKKWGTFNNISNSSQHGVTYFMCSSLRWYNPGYWTLLASYLKAYIPSCPS